MYLDIENFGRHEHLQIRVDHGDVTFVVGNNRVGKSTVRDAIEFALLGTCQIRGFRTMKDVRAYMVRQGAAQAIVKFEWNGKGVRRSITPRGGHRIEVLRGATYLEANATEYAEYLGVDATALRVALDCDQFFRMEEPVRRQLLISVKDSSGFDAETVWDALGTALTSYADEDPARKGKLRGLCEVAALKGFRLAGTQAVEERRQAKRDSEELGRRIEAISLDPMIDGFDASRGTLEEQERTLKDLEAEFRSKQAKVLTSAATIDGQISEAKASIERAMAELAEMPTPNWTVTGSDGKERRLREEMDLLRITMGTDEVECAAADTKVNELIIARERLFDRLQALGEAPKHPSICPAVAFDMKCTVKPEKFVAAWEASGGGERQVALLEKQISEMDCEIEEAKRAALDKKSTRKAHADEMAGLQKEHDALARQEEAIQRAEAAIQASQKRLAELEAERDAAPKDGAVSAEELAKIEARIDIGRKVVAHRRRIEAAKGDRIRLETERNAVELDVKWWDEIEKQFRPDGIERALAKLATSVFAKTLEACDPLAMVKITDEMDLTVNGLLIAACSKSEQLCGGIALQAAMAMHLGLDFLVVDELDKLDRGWRQQFQSWADGNRGSWQSGVLALATSDANPPGTPPAGFVTYWLQNDAPPTYFVGEDAE